MATFESLNQALKQAVDDGVFAGANLFARNKSGTLRYSNAVGRRSLAEGSNEPMQENTVLAIASATKLITSISALQLVERGLIKLDDDVLDIVPLLAQQEVFVAADDNKDTTTEKRKTPITLRQLLTHSAGCAYSVMNPRIDTWRAANGLAVGSGGTFEERIVQPLAFQPGTSWEYGTGIDWVGRIVENLSGQSLDEYAKVNILAPLGIKDFTFWIDKHPDMKSRLAKMTIRSGYPKPTGPAADYNGPLITDGLKDCFGGHGGFGDLSQYIEILYSLLVDDEKLLKKSTTAQLFSPQLSAEESKRTLSHETGKKDSLFIGEFLDTGDYDWGLGGLLIGQDLPGWRRKGRMIWSGLPNVFWFIDREAGICGVFGTQLLPPGDKQCMKVITHFEKAVYSEAEALQKSKL
ncbi:hypothetical protein AAFC00_007100 [Neodothiora populina]